MINNQKQLHNALTNITTQTVQENTIEADLQAALKVLKHLKSLLAAADTEARALFLDSEELLKVIYGEKIQQLGRLIQAFDFESALIITESISD